MRREERVLRRASGFTLIELLVVVAIIGLLASIMMPSLSKARELAKSASCISNLHNLGLMLSVYSNDNQRYYPTAYSYIDGNSSAGGYTHWSAALDSSEYVAPPTAAVASGTPVKYPRSAALYVCPSHAPGGWAPTNFTPERIPAPPAGQATQAPGLDDRQAPRLIYVANEAIMPRKKFSAAKDAASPPGTSNLCQVSADEIDGAGNTILLAEFSDNPNCIWGSSVGGGSAYKSHRPTNGVKIQSNGVFDGEAYATGTKVYKLTEAEARAAIDALKADKAAGPTSHHISYINAEAHGTSGSNYTFADGHAAKATLKATLDPTDYKWGNKMYSCVDKPLVQDNP